MQRKSLEKYLNSLLKTDQVQDYCPNGLQIQGGNEVSKIVTGVTASQALINRAIEEKADAIIVHHGIFWKNDPYAIRGMKYQRIKALLDHNINLFVYHLPLDVHAELGNNVQLGKSLKIDQIQAFEGVNPIGIIMRGEINKKLSGEQFAQQISTMLKRQCLHIAPPSHKEIKKVAWCTGGGQGYIEIAAEQGFDAFITGEASEKTTHIAREMNIHFFAAGHHATERNGIKALSDHLVSQFELLVEFIDIDNPV